MDLVAVNVALVPNVAGLLIVCFVCVRGEQTTVNGWPSAKSRHASFSHKVVHIFSCCGTRSFFLSSLFDLFV